VLWVDGQVDVLLAVHEVEGNQCLLEYLHYGGQVADFWVTIQLVETLAVDVLLDYVQYFFMVEVFNYLRYVGV